VHAIVSSLAGPVMMSSRMTLIVSHSFKLVLNPDTMMHEMADICKFWGFVAMGITALMSLSTRLRAWLFSTFVQNLSDARFRNVMEEKIEYFETTATCVLLARPSEDVAFVLKI
jgi:hypothetical protein